MPSAVSAASAAAVVALIPLRLRYAGAVGHDRERLQWFAIGAVLAGAIAAACARLEAFLPEQQNIGLEELFAVSIPPEESFQ